MKTAMLLNDLTSSKNKTHMMTIDEEDSIDILQHQTSGATSRILSPSQKINTDNVVKIEEQQDHEEAGTFDSQEIQNVNIRVYDSGFNEKVSQRMSMVTSGQTEEIDPQMVEEFDQYFKLTNTLMKMSQIRYNIANQNKSVKGELKNKKILNIELRKAKREKQRYLK